MQDNTCVCCGRIIPEGRHICLSCGDYDDQQRFKPDTLPIVRTNGDRIRQMTDDELADTIGFNECKDTAHGYECPAWIQPHCDGECKKHFLAWLRKEADDANNSGG